MKIISVVIFLVAMVVTWGLTRPTHGSGAQSVHLGVQNDLKNIISEYVQKNLPQSQNLRFDKFWTESIAKGRIKATFQYTFDDPSRETGDTHLEIAGTAILSKVDENPKTITYNLDELRVSDSTIRFDEPIQITAGSKDTN